MYGFSSITISICSARGWSTELLLKCGAVSCCLASSFLTCSFSLLLLSESDDWEEEGVGEAWEYKSHLKVVMTVLATTLLKYQCSTYVWKRRTCNSSHTESSAENIIVHSILLTVLCAPHTHAARTQRNLLSSVGRRDHIMGIALKGLLESTTRVVSGIALDSVWLELQVRLFQT